MKKFSKDKGFSLVEILASMTILSLGLLFLLPMMVVSMQAKISTSVKPLSLLSFFIIYTSVLVYEQYLYLILSEFKIYTLNTKSLYQREISFDGRVEITLNLLS
jgi:prepilin-type N-terminal cleavage/methylation domain-containing protein